MDLKTHLGQDRFFWMKDDLTRADAAHLMVEVIAPPLPVKTAGRVGRDGRIETKQTKAPTNLVVVLDRSGSMSGSRLSDAKRALLDVVDRLGPDDSFGLVTFDDHIEVPVPAGRVTNRAAIKHAIKQVEARGSTDLGSGLIKGLQEARRLKSKAGVRVLLISDGHANAGVTDPVKLGTHVGGFLEHRITTSTLGMGLGYDEWLLSVIAQAGGGNEHFAEESDTAAEVIAAECGDLIIQRYLNVRLIVEPGTGMDGVVVLNEATISPCPDGRVGPQGRIETKGIAIELGGLRPDQVRTLVMRFDPTPTSRPGRRKVANLRLEYVLADDLSEHTVATSVWARVVRVGDRPANVDYDVMAEVLFQNVQRRKRRAMRALTIGDVDEARRIFEAIERHMGRAMPHVPRARRAELQSEIDGLHAYDKRLTDDIPTGADYTAKAMSVEINGLSRMRGGR